MLTNEPDCKVLPEIHIFVIMASVSIYFVVVIFSHLKVYLGVNDTNFLPDGVAVVPIPHPQFKSNSPGHDIMLLKVIYKV